MNIRPEELKENGFVKFRELDHSQIVPFVQEGFKYRTWAGKVFKGMNYLFVMLYIALGVFFFLLFDLRILRALILLGQGIGISLLLIPVHELIHMIAYKIKGAKQAKMQAHWKKLYFLATADQFVTDRRELRIIALAPFLTISLAMIIGILFFQISMPGETEMTFLLSTVLVVHTQFCAGDFAMMSFVEHRGGEVVLYDDEATTRSYFFEHLGSP